MIACRYSPPIVPNLLKAGAKVNGSDYDGYTPLMIACQYSPPIVPDLLKAGIDLFFIKKCFKCIYKLTFLYDKNLD